MKIFSLFPHLSAFLSTKGISMSQASFEKEQAINQANVDFANLNTYNNSLYVDKVTILSERGVGEPEYKSGLHISAVELGEIAERLQNQFIKSSFYGFAIRQKSEILSKIDGLDADSIASVFGIEKPKQFDLKSPVRKQATINKDINKYCEISNVEELFLHASFELFGLIQKFYEEGMRSEAICSVLGKYFTNNKSSLLFSIINAPLIEQGTSVKETVTSTFVVSKERVLNPAYEKESFITLRDKITEVAQEEQRKKNYVLASCKDIARELDIKYQVQYSKELQEYQLAFQKYQHEVADYNNKVEEARASLKQEVASLLIIEA